MRTSTAMGTGTKRLITTTIIAVGWTFIGTAPAQAQTDQGNATDQSVTLETNEQATQWSFTFDPQTRYQFDAEFDQTGNGDYSVWRTGFDFEAFKPISETMVIKLGLGYEYSNYDFQRPISFLSTGVAEPFSDIHLIDFSLTSQWLIDDQWGWYAGLGGRFAGESGADLSDAGSFAGWGGASYRFNDDLSASFGLLIATQIEDDPLIIPDITMKWQIADQWRFVFDHTEGALWYDVDEHMSLGLGSAWEYRRFRLEDNALKQSTVIQDTAIPIYGTIHYKADNGTTIDLTAGLNAFQEFRVEDRFGNNRTDYETSAAPFVGFNVRFTF